ncbi:Leucine-rich repeat-containing N-terminal [Theobroma cacao]|nr:Leucine-rich repeat-containing N-terminal [Theobroma cacao]
MQLLSSQNQSQSNEHNSVEADPNGFLDDWSPVSLSPCSWLGVSCTRSGQVNALNFTNAWSDRSLNFLDISPNNLSGNFSVPEFWACDKPLDLGLSNNALYGSGIPESLTNCQLLENHDLSHNKLQDKIPAALATL